MSELNPSHIMQVGSGFWASKVLLSAVNLGVFTRLANNPMTGAELEKALDLHPRATWDFLDTLVALKFLDRDGDGEQGKYKNTPETDLFLDKKKAAVHRWHPRNVQCPSVQILERA